MLSTRTAQPCRHCGKPAPLGRQVHSRCIRRYRASEDYRRPTLDRDGGECVRCPAWRNRLATRLAERTGRQRRLHADHIVALGNGGTHDATNMQTLCIPHHRRKTRVDLATMRGRHDPRQRRLGLALAGVAAVLYAWQDPDQRPVVVVMAVLGVVLLGAMASRHRAKLRLRHVVCVVTGEAVTKRRAARGKCWRLWRPEGSVWPRWRPDVIRVRYPHTFKDQDPKAQVVLEETISAKYGRDYGFVWRTEVDRLDARRPDPLSDPTPTRWPNIEAARLDLWDPIPVGLDRIGRAVMLALPYRNLLIGGAPDSGKGSATAMIAATAALDPDVTLHCFDGKNVDMVEWEPVADTFVTTSMDEANEALAKLTAIMDAKYELLHDMPTGAQGRPRKIDRDIAKQALVGEIERSAQGLDVLIVDELAYYLHAPVKKEVKDRFTGQLRDLIQRGRAAGIIVVAATQRPAADVIPTSIRDLFAYRWSMRVDTSDASDMVLGSGLATLGHRADRIPTGTPGVGLLKAEGGMPVRCKAHYLTDADLYRLATRARELRRDPRWDQDAAAS